MALIRGIIERTGWALTDSGQTPYNSIAAKRGHLLPLDFFDKRFNAIAFQQAPETGFPRSVSHQKTLDPLGMVRVVRSPG